MMGMMVDQNVIAEEDRKDLIEGQDWFLRGPWQTGLWFWSENDLGEAIADPR
jgi:hypothetical protein